MSSPQYASLNAGLLARKGEARPSQEPSFGSKPWQPPVVPVATITPPVRPPAVPQAAATVSNVPDLVPDPVETKVRLQDVASVWPHAKPASGVDIDMGGWIAAKPGAAQLSNYAQPIKTTIRLTHAQARAVKLAALVLDKPQQEILTAGLLGQLEALACADLRSCSCFKTVVEGLKMPGAMEPPLAY
ncbi:MAG: hypothetical protein EON93_09990 [Burkholderiales bacterium]|nr:MAG: hypothetical protein EON93_09990 [Burkholderiales bacterium]